TAEGPQRYGRVSRFSAESLNFGSQTDPKEACHFVWRASFILYPRCDLPFRIRPALNFMSILLAS
ncbi:MAG: hypothetical protein VXZ53_07500, partial [Planctomycetota bacterium]|nr:hypothetical protein [Planctomycetota bacterium]